MAAAFLFWVAALLFGQSVQQQGLVAWQTPASGGGIALQQFGVGSNNTAPTVTLNTNTGSPNLLVVVCMSYMSCSVALSPANCTLSSLTAQAYIFRTEQIFYCYGFTRTASQQINGTTAGGGCIVTATFSGTAGSTVDQQAGTIVTGTNNLSPGSITPGFANELAISGLGTENTTSDTITISGSTIIATQLPSGGNYDCSMAYTVQTAAVAFNPQWTFTNMPIAGGTNGSFR